MKATSMQGPRPPNIVHRWSCTRKGPYTEQVVHEAHGQAYVVVQCQECNGDDSTDDPEAA